jgi:hypothetical protein
VRGRIRTDRRTLIAEKIADAGGDTYTVTASKIIVTKIKALAETYRANTGAKGSTDREIVEAIDDGFKPLDQSGATFSEFVKSFGLCLEYVKDFFSGIACIDLCGQWVVAKILPRLNGVFSQRRIEEGFEVRERGSCTGS